MTERLVSWELTPKQADELAERALVAQESGTDLAVTPDEFRFLRNQPFDDEGKEWDAILRRVSERRGKPISKGHVRRPVRVRVKWRPGGVEPGH